MGVRAIIPGESEKLTKKRNVEEDERKAKENLKEKGYGEEEVEEIEDVGKEGRGKEQGSIRHTKLKEVWEK